jgi:hypothetical protein
MDLAGKRKKVDSSELIATLLSLPKGIEMGRGGTGRRVSTSGSNEVERDIVMHFRMIYVSRRGLPAVD